MLSLTRAALVMVMLSRHSNRSVTKTGRKGATFTYSPYSGTDFSSCPLLRACLLISAWVLEGPSEPSREASSWQSVNV